MNSFSKFALTAAAAVLVTVVAIKLVPTAGGPGAPGVSTSPSESGPADPSSTSADIRYYYGDYTVGRHSITTDGVALSFTVQATGWEPGPIFETAPNSGAWTSGSLLISKSTVMSQSAEALILWTVFPGGASADPCGHLANQPVGASASELATALSTAPGTELESGPTDATVGGFSSKHVTLTVREDLGCDPGFFYTWAYEEWGAIWPGTDVGTTINLWIVDVDGTMVFIESETSPGAGAAVGQEIQDIVGSITFD